MAPGGAGPVLFWLGEDTLEKPEELLVSETHSRWMEGWMDLWMDG